MGMNHAGEIAYLTRLARPTVAVITNAAPAHLEGLGSVANVARAKGEIFEGLGDDGVAVVNVDDPQAAVWRQLADGRRVIGFGLGADADVRAAARPKAYSSEIILTAVEGSVEFELPLPGLHNVRNAVAAAAATLAAGVSLGTVAEALSRYAGIKGRLQRRIGTAGACVIDDSYNANPDSMRAAIDVLAGQAGRRVLVMGDMGEVGASGGRFHEEIGAYAKDRGIERLFALGELSARAVRRFGSGGDHFTDIEELVAAVRTELGADTVVLVKGSRFMRMERVVAVLVRRTEAAEAAH
jgi:UDP-N-acetylmuramoyl-tripeptide--D-alanyl-D-alanine ligase